MKSHAILKQFFARKQEANPSYSLRALARDLKLSPSFVSGLLNGTKKIPTGKLDLLCKALDLDRVSDKALRKSLALEKVDQTLFQDFDPSQDHNHQQNFKPLSKRKLSLLSKWYYVAVLDLVTCSNFKSDVSWMSRKLGLLPSETEEAIEVLKKLELISVENGSLQKKTSKIRFTTTQSQSEIRQFHKQLIQKALQELEFKTSETDFEKRLISGITFAANKEKIEKAKERLSNILHEISADLMEGDCTEVYQLNLQFFPLSK